MHVTKDTRKKLETIAEVRIFPNNRMTIVRRDIKFDEGKAMQLSLERELDLHAEEELLVPEDDQSQDVD